MEDAILFARGNHFDAYCAVGGGSVMDTAKVANLFSVYRDAELLDFVNAPEIPAGVSGIKSNLRYLVTSCFENVRKVFLSSCCR